MATSETAFQTELVQVMNARGMHAFKASHREKTGVVDLYCRNEDFGFWIECKFMKIERNFQTGKVSLTRPQWAFMRDEMKAGGLCATIIGYTRKTEGYDKHGLLICDPREQHTQVNRAWVDDTTHPAHIVKTRGTDWPVDLITMRIGLMFNGAIPWAHLGRDE